MSSEVVTNSTTDLLSMAWDFLDVFAPILTIAIAIGILIGFGVMLVKAFKADE